MVCSCQRLALQIGDADVEAPRPGSLEPANDIGLPLDSIPSDGHARDDLFEVKFVSDSLSTLTSGQDAILSQLQTLALDVKALSAEMRVMNRQSFKLPSKAASIAASDREYVVASSDGSDAVLSRGTTPHGFAARRAAQHEIPMPPPHIRVSSVPTREQSAASSISPHGLLTSLSRPVSKPQSVPVSEAANSVAWSQQCVDEAESPVWAKTEESLFTRRDWGTAQEDAHQHVYHSQLPEWPEKLEARGLKQIEVNCTPRTGKAAKLVKAAGRTKHSLKHAIDSRNLHPHQHEEEQSAVLSPNGPFRLVFDILITIVLIYDMWTIPGVIAWELNFQGLVFAGSIVTSLFWAMDIAVTLRTGFYTDYGELEDRPRHIFRAYLKTWFVPDLCVVMLDTLATAFLLISHTSSTASSESGLLVVKCCRILRIVRLARITRLNQVRERISDRSRAMDLAMDVASSIFMILWVNHLMGCLWYWIGRSNMTDTGLRWLDIMDHEEGKTYAEENSWYQYFTCLHWSMCQMTPGSMQVHPVNTVERIMSISTLVLGMIFFSHFISLLSAKLTSIRLADAERHQQLKTLRDFLRYGHVSKDLSIRVYRQVTSRMLAKISKKLVHAQDVKALDWVSSDLRTQLHTELCGRRLIQHPLFQLCWQNDPHAIPPICAEIESMVLKMGDTLFLPLTPASKAYLTLRGESVYSVDKDRDRYSPDKDRDQDKNRSFHLVKEGKWVAEMTLWTMWLHVGSLEALQTSSFMAMDAEAVATLLAGHPTLQSFVVEYAAKYHKKVTSARPPKAWPNDLEVPDAGFGEICLSMTHDSRDLTNQVALHILSHNGSLMDRGWLEQELTAGVAVLMVNGNGDVERILAVVRAKVERSDGSILAQIAKRDQLTAELVVRCKLPATKLKDKTSYECVLDLMQSEMSGLRTFEVDPAIKTQESQESERTNFTSQYIIYEHLVRCDPGAEGVTVRIHYSDQSLYMDRGDIFKLGNKTIFTFEGNDSEIRYYMWMTDMQYKHYRSPAGQQALEQLAGKNLQWNTY